MGERREVAVMEVNGAWRVMLAEATVPGVAKAWGILMTVADAGDNEATARAWANWWDMAIEAHGLEGARALYPSELARCEAAAAKFEEFRKAFPNAGGDFDELRALRSLEELAGE